MNIKIENMNELIAELHATETQTDKAMSLAINRAVSSARTASSREMRKEWNIPARALTRYMYSKPSTPSTLTNITTISSTPISLLMFTTETVERNIANTRNQKGVKYRIKKGAGNIKLFEHAFVRRVKSGVPYVLIRKKGSTARYPITPLFSITPTTMFKKSGALKVFEDRAEEQIKKRFEHEIKRLTK